MESGDASPGKKEHEERPAAGVKHLRPRFLSTTMSKLTAKEIRKRIAEEETVKLDVLQPESSA
jgi:hypothetical protein